MTDSVPKILSFCYLVVGGGWVEPQRSSKTYPDYREKREQSVQVKKMDFGVRLHVFTSLCRCPLPV